MPDLFLTLIIAFVVVVFAIALLAIGWLITGKTKLEKQCGKDPTKKRSASCHSCDLCSHTDEKAKPQEQGSSSLHSPHDQP